MIFPNFSQPTTTHVHNDANNRDSTKFPKAGQLWVNQWDSNVHTRNYNFEQLNKMFFLEKLSRSTFWVVRYCPRCFLSYFDTFLNLHQLVYPPSQLKAPLCSDVANVDFSIWKKKISQMQKMHFCRL